MTTVWLIHVGGCPDVVASTQEVAIDWLLEHGYTSLDDKPILDVYNEAMCKWEEWSMVKVAEYFGCSPREAMVKLLNLDYDEDMFNWAVWLEQIDWIG